MPILDGKIMAVKTIGRIPCRQVVGRGGSLIFIQMTVNTLISDAVKSQIRFRKMAIPTINLSMYSEQRKSIALV
jgi:hypothetical protein